MCAAVIFSKGSGSVVESRTKGFNLLLLGFDFFVQNSVSCRECLNGGVVFVELGGNQLHFRSQNLKGLVDFGQGFFEFLFALKSDFQTEIIRQMTTSSLNPIRDDIVNKVLTLGLCLAVPLLVALPQIQEQTKRHQPHLIHGKMQVSDAVIKKPGKQFLVCYPTCAFFVSVSLSMLRLVPLYRASVMAVL